MGLGHHPVRRALRHQTGGAEQHQMIGEARRQIQIVQTAITVSAPLWLRLRNSRRISI